MLSLYFIYERECEILYELIKYSYYQNDKQSVKDIIYDTMNDFGKIDFLLDIDNNFEGIPYSTLLQNGYVFERFFSTNSLRFLYGDDLPKRIREKTYFPEYFCDDIILRDSTDKAYEYFRVIFHKNLREINDTKEKYNWDFTNNNRCDALHNLIDFIAHNSNCKFISANIFWVMSILRKKHNTSNKYIEYIPQESIISPLYCRIMFITINTFILIIAMTTI